MRGLHGHLRFKEGLSGDELDRVYAKAKRQNQQVTKQDDLIDVLDEYSAIERRLNALQEFKPAFMWDEWSGEDLESALKEKKKQVGQRIKQKLSDG